MINCNQYTENNNPINNTTYERIFTASSELFSGFTVKINIQYIDSTSDIIRIFLDELMKVLKENNFQALLEKIVENEYHIHSHTFVEI